MNTNISKLQAQLQDLSPQQLQMVVQGGSAPPWLVAIEQQRRADMTKRMQQTTPPQSTVMQDLEGSQGLQGLQSFAGGGGIQRLSGGGPAKRKLTPEEEYSLEAVELNVPPTPGELTPAPDPYVEKINALRQAAPAEQPVATPAAPSMGLEGVPDASGVDENAQIMEVLRSLPHEQFKEIVARANAKEMSPQDTFRVLQELNRRNIEQSKASTPQAAVPPQPVKEAPVSPQVSQGIATLSPQESTQLPQDILAKEEELKQLEANLQEPSPIEAEVAAQKAAKAAEQLRPEELEAIKQEGIANLAAQQKAKEQQVLDEEKPLLDKKTKDAQEWEDYLESRRQAHAGIAQLASKETSPVPAPQAPVQPAPVNQAVSQGIAQVAAEPSTPVGSLPPEPVQKPFVYADQPAEFTKGLQRMRESLNADDTGPKLRTVESEKNIAERESRLKDFEDNNLGWSVMQAAAAMMAGDSPYASVNIGKGALAGLQKYADGKKNINDLGREINVLQAARETAYNERDYKAFTQKQNQLAMMTELAERANQAAQNRASQESMNNAGIASHERIAKGHDAAMLNSAGIRAAGSGGAGGMLTDDWIRASTAIDSRKDAVQKEYNDRLKDIATNIIDPDEKIKAELDAKKILTDRLVEIARKEEIVNKLAGLPGLQTNGAPPPPYSDRVKIVDTNVGGSQEDDSKKVYTQEDYKKVSDDILRASKDLESIKDPSARKLQEAKIQELRAKAKKIFDALPSKTQGR